MGLLSVAAFSPGLGAETLNVERITWQDLHYRATKLFVTAEAQISLETQGEEVQVFLGSKALGRTSETRLWLEPETAKALREEKLKLHRDAGLRTYAYGSDHAMKVRFHERPVAEGRDPLETWVEKSRQRQPFGTGNLPPVVTTPSALLYLLGASTLDKKGDSLQAAIFADERLVTARAEVVAEESFDGEIEALGGGERYRPRVALRILLTGRDAAGGPIDLELLGLEGDLEILLDRDKRLPLAIRGAMPVLGRIDVRLRSARFR